jgi:hypothetical protein
MAIPGLAAAAVRLVRHATIAPVIPVLTVAAVTGRIDAHAVALEPIVFVTARAGVRLALAAAVAPIPLVAAGATRVALVYATIEEVIVVLVSAADDDRGRSRVRHARVVVGLVVSAFRTGLFPVGNAVAEIRIEIVAGSAAYVVVFFHHGQLELLVVFVTEVFHHFEREFAHAFRGEVAADHEVDLGSVVYDLQALGERSIHHGGLYPLHVLFRNQVHAGLVGFPYFRFGKNRAHLEAHVVGGVVMARLNANLFSGQVLAFRGGSTEGEAPGARELRRTEKKNFAGGGFF